MIKRIYETHLEVTDVKRTIEFFEGKLGLKVGYGNETSDAVFFWVGEVGASMLGVWKVPEGELHGNHFAFEVDIAFLKNAKQWLNERGIQTIGSQGLTNREPIVQAWMPAASVYFLDPDGNKLEFIAMLDGEPLKNIPRKYYLSEWEELHKQN
ncbi:VOC family protein [Bacillus sp. BGMRC 2118]|nr:VOC family protein [Bacillus sp. BGMRC 2118]